MVAVGRFGVTFTGVHGGGITADKKITVAFTGSDKRVYELDFEPGCVSAVVGALIAGLGQVGDPETLQPLKVVGVQPGRFDDGSPMMFLSVEGGGTISMLLKEGDLNELIDQLKSISSPPGVPKH